MIINVKISGFLSCRAFGLVCSCFRVVPSGLSCRAVLSPCRAVPGPSPYFFVPCLAQAHIFSCRVVLVPPGLVPVSCRAQKPGPYLQL